jgi:serine/threonine protein kinase
MAAAGDRVDKFTLVRQLGAGGMGETWEAVRQTGHDFEQRVAIKLADRDVLDCSDGLAAFRSEAALSASLRHPNIAAVLDIDEHGAYIVCELVDGADLRCVLRAAPGGKLAVPVWVHIMAQIARGLSHAHRRILRGQLSPVIHRDMSPGNVVIDYDGNVKIVDFGIAKATAVVVDVAEAIQGKLAYMAPEQAMGTRMDGRVDQYALGVIAYEALTGVRPNDGPHEGATLACILSGQHVPIATRAPGLDPRLAAIVERMLALQPDRRFGSMEAVLDALVPLAPSFTVHRELIPLVMYARQPHTIVRENGKFVSRPVETIAHMPAIATPPAHADARSSVDAHAATDAPHGVAAAQAVAAAGARAVPKPQPSAAESAAPGPAKPRMAAAAHAATTARTHALPAAFSRRVRAWSDGALASRGFWQALTGLGALLLAFVAWVAMSPDALFSLGLVPRSGAHYEANLAVAQAGSQPPAAEGGAGLVAVKVSVSPAGRVWVDQQLRGAAAPLLTLELPPGQHVISAGRDVPLQSRVVQLAPAAPASVAFDLEGQ